MPLPTHLLISASTRSFVGENRFVHDWCSVGRRSLEGRTVGCLSSVKKVSGPVGDFEEYEEPKELAVSSETAYNARMHNDRLWVEISWVGITRGFVELHKCILKTSISEVFRPI